SLIFPETYANRLLNRRSLSSLPDAGSSVEEVEFNWDEYLEDTGATAAPHGSFKHVDTSLQNGFAPGMKLEVAVKSDQNTYWVATIITTCGQLLLLRYDGYGEDRKADFWCDIMTADLHPIGWCEQNKKILKVPEGIKDKIPDQEEFLQRVLKGACSAPANLLEGVSAAMCCILGFVLIFPFVIKEIPIQIVSSIPFFKFREHCNMLLTLKFHSLVFPIYNI
uniref:Scm like with four mbt domains 1 n=1 Tax=Buteo japonicus TaxID=224669 RepID=A0A8C0BGT1_9AVES